MVHGPAGDGRSGSDWRFTAANGDEAGLAVCSANYLGIYSSTPPAAGKTAAATKALAAIVAQLARAHWGIENSLHWRLDVLMGEDANRARSGEAPANLAILRKMTLNTLRIHAPFPGKKGADMTIRSRQYVASINPNYLASFIQNPSLAS